MLARVMLSLGVAANVAYGAAHGLTGAAISAWPAIAFIGSAELLIAKYPPYPARTRKHEYRRRRRTRRIRRSS